MNKLLQILRKALTRIGVQEGNKLVWGYGYKKSEVDKEIVEYYHAAKLLRDQELVGYSCLDKKELEAIKSGIGRVVGVQCSESEYDYTKEPRPDKDRWLLQNPDCVTYEYYADYIAAQCKKLSIDILVVRKECEKVGIALDVRKQTICEAIELALDVQEQKCDIDIDVKVNMQQCIIDFETIVIPQKCDIDFKTFVYEISCGATVDTVVSKLNCAVNVNVDAEETDEDCEGQTPYPPCRVTINCGTVAGCDYFSEDFEDRVEEVTEYNSTVALPSLIGYCEPCGQISAGNSQWSFEYEFDGEESELQRAVGTWSGNATCQCYEQEGIALKECFVDVLSNECFNECADTYGTCVNECSEDEECLEACQVAYNSCLNSCLSGKQLPSLNMCECGYEAGFVTDWVNNSETIYCDGGLSYIDYVATVTDSLGNTKECPLRFFNVLA